MADLTLPALVTKPTAVSFDLGQTLVDLDYELLIAQAATQRVTLDRTVLVLATSEAWRRYEKAKANLATGPAAWAAFMKALLLRARVPCDAPHPPGSNAEIDALTDYLWKQQPERNLWRQPIDGMFELVFELADLGVPVGVLTNSEGRARQLVQQLGLGGAVTAVVDSGCVGIEKPDSRVFHLMARELGCAVEKVVHVGDSYQADVMGALSTGMRAIWFTKDADREAPPGVPICRTAAEVRTALLFQAPASSGWGAPGCV